MIVSVPVGAHDDDSNLAARFGARILELRTGRGWSRETAANLIGISQHYLRKLENGQRNLALTLVGRIAEVYGVDEFDLFVWRGASIRHDVVELLRAMNEDELQSLKTLLSRAEDQQRTSSRRPA